MASFTPYAVEDALERRPPAERLFVHDGALLTQAHFETEQTYHRSRLARVLAYLHGHGTVAGLDVTIRPPEGGAAAEIQVAPGIAVDRLGRLMELPHLACLRVGVWFDQQVADPETLALVNGALRPAGGGRPPHVVADVYGSFEASARAPEPAFATGNADNVDSVQAARILDALRLDLLIRESDDDRLPESAISALLPGAVDAAAVREAKRTRLWAALQPDEDPFALRPEEGPLEHDLTRQDGTEVFLARLVLPVIDDGGAPRFDDAFDMSAAAVRPAQDERPYCWAAPELALLRDLRR